MSRKKNSSEGIAATSEATPRNRTKKEVIQRAEAIVEVKKKRFKEEKKAKEIPVVDIADFVFPDDRDAWPFPYSTKYPRNSQEIME